MNPDAHFQEMIPPEELEGEGEEEEEEEEELSEPRDGSSSSEGSTDLTDSSGLFQVTLATPNKERNKNVSKARPQRGHLKCVLIRDLLKADLVVWLRL